MRAMRIILILFLAGFTTTLFGQDTLVLTNGDTLKGKIKIDLPTKAYESITIKIGKEKTKYKAYQFLSFTYKGNRYVPIKFNQVYRIMQEEVSGYLGLYNYRDDGAYEFGLKYLHKIDGSGLPLPNLSFKKQMTKFLYDCPDIIEGLETDKYKRSELVTIVEDYNTCVEQQTKTDKSNIATISDTTNPTLDLIDSIKDKLDDRDEELTSILTDIQSKITQKKTIPDYLIDALREKSSEYEDLTDDIDELLSSLQ